MDNCWAYTRSVRLQVLEQIKTVIENRNQLASATSSDTSTALHVSIEMHRIRSSSPTGGEKREREEGGLNFYSFVDLLPRDTGLIFSRAFMPIKKVVAAKDELETREKSISGRSPWKRYWIFSMLNPGAILTRVKWLTIRIGSESNVKVKEFLERGMNLSSLRENNLW